MLKYLFLLLAFVILLLPPDTLAKNQEAELKQLTLTNRLKVTAYKNIFFSSQPQKNQIQELRKQGFSTVISLRMPSEKMPFNEAEVAKASGLKFVNIPINGTKELTAEKVDAVTQAVIKHRKTGKILIHCSSGQRAGLWAGAHFYKDHKYPKAKALNVSKVIGLSKPELQKKLQKFIQQSSK